MNAVVEILKRAKERIGTPEKWCKGYYAKDVRGRFTEALSVDACTFCAEGAVFAECGSYGGSHDALSMLRVTSANGYIATFNDLKTTTHDDVMAWFDRAIALAEAEGGK